MFPDRTSHRRRILAALLLVAALAPAVAAPSRESPLRVRFLFWHESPADARARDGVLRGLGFARIPVDVGAFNAGFDIGAITDAAARESEERRATAAAIARLEAWRDASEIDVLVAMGTRAALIAKDVYRDIPVVFTAVTHPVASGVTESWGPTGRNLAGNSNWVGMERVLPLFQRTMRGGGRLGVVTSPTNAVSAAEVEEAWRYAAQTPQLSLVVRKAATPDELRDAVRAMADDIDALWIPIDDLGYRNVPLIRAALGERRIPIVSSSFHAVRQGAVVGIAADYDLLGLRAAELIRRIAVLGEDPGTLPIGRLATFDVEVNLGAAEAQGITLPPELAASADRLLREPDGER